MRRRGAWEGAAWVCAVVPLLPGAVAGNGQAKSPVATDLFQGGLDAADVGVGGLLQVLDEVGGKGGGGFVFEGVVDHDAPVFGAAVFGEQAAQASGAGAPLAFELLTGEGIAVAEGGALGEEGERLREQFDALLVFGAELVERGEITRGHGQWHGGE